MTIEQDLPQLAQLNAMLAKALADPHPGLATWCLCVHDLIAQMHAITGGEEFAKAPLPVMLGVLARRRSSSLHIIEITQVDKAVHSMQAFIGDNAAMNKRQLLEVVRLSLQSAQDKNSEELRALLIAELAGIG